MNFEFQMESYQLAGVAYLTPYLPVSFKEGMNLIRQQLLQKSAVISFHTT